MRHIVWTKSFALRSNSIWSIGPHNHWKCLTPSIVDHINIVTSSPSKTPSYMILGSFVAVSLISKTSTKERASYPNWWCQGQVMCSNLTWRCTWRPLVSSLALDNCIRFNPSEESKGSFTTWVTWASHDYELHRAITLVMKSWIRQHWFNT